MVNTLFAASTRGIVSGIDVEHNKVYFTFHTISGIETLVYDEQQRMFIGNYDYTPNLYLPYRNKIFMYNRYAEQGLPEQALLNEVWQLEGGLRYEDFYKRKVSIYPEVCTMRITEPVIESGIVAIILAGETFNIYLYYEPCSENPIYSTALQIRNQNFPGWVIGGTDVTITFSKTHSTNVIPEPVVDVKDTGVQCTFTHVVTYPESINKFKLVFYVNGMGPNANLSNLQKEYIVHKLFASDNFLKEDHYGDWVRKFEWETEYQKSSLDLSGPLSSENDSEKFWKTPTFEDHMWYVPIDVQDSVNKGPNGTDVFNTFETGATMRGSWLKVTITYSGNEKIFIKNCITNFLNSYS